MLLETPYFAIDLPADCVVDPSDGMWAAVHERSGREIVLTATNAPVDRPLDETLVGLAEMRGGALRAHGASEVSPVELATRGELRVATFSAALPSPEHAFCAVTALVEPVLGQRLVVTLSVYRHRKPGTSPVSAPAFREACLELLSSLVLVPQRAALERSATAGPAIDRARIYPYLVPAGYLEGRASDLPQPQHLGHGIHVALAEDFDGAVRIHFLEDLDCPAELAQTAMENLMRDVSEAKIGIQRFVAPRGLPGLLFGPEWVAPSLLLVPSFLHAIGAEILGDGPRCAAVPHQGALLLFRAEDPSYLRDVQEAMAGVGADGRKPLTTGLFAIHPDRFEPID